MSDLHPGFAYTCDVFRPVTTARDDNTGTPQAVTPDRIAHNVACAAGEYAAVRHEVTSHGGQEQHADVAVHVANGVDVKQGDAVVLKGSPWDGPYTVVAVRRLVPHQRVLCERARRG